MIAYISKDLRKNKLLKETKQIKNKAFEQHFAWVWWALLSPRDAFTSAPFYMLACVSV